MSKKPLVEVNKFHELLLNIGSDTMLRSSDLLSLKVKDVLNEDGSAKDSAKVRQQKTKNNTPDITFCKSSLIYQKTQNVEVCCRLLGHSNVTATSSYLGIEVSDTLEAARKINI